MIPAQEDRGILEALVARALGAALSHDNRLRDLDRSLALEHVQLMAQAGQTRSVLEG